MDERGILRDKTYSESYYSEHVEVGLDYLVFGDWHIAYAEMVTEMTLQRNYSHPFMLEAGCACGSMLKGFRENGVYDRVLGIDLSEHMISLGRKEFGFSPDDLICGSIANIPVADSSLTLIDSGQVLEHIPDSEIDRIFAEFYRTLAPGGRMFHNLAALKHGDPLDLHDGDPTHYNIKPTMYWVEKFARAGFLPDFESYDRFVRSAKSPGAGYPNFFSTYHIWTNFTLIKPM